METAIIISVILGMAVVILLFLRIVTKSELLSMTKQLRNIKGENTNSLIRCESSDSICKKSNQ